MPQEKEKSAIVVAQSLLHLWDPRKLRVWAEKWRHQRGLRAWLARQLEIVIRTARNIHQADTLLRAAALTYHTLLAIVPLLAVAFALFKAFGGLKKMEEPLRRVILDNLAVGKADEVGRWLETFIANINAGAIAGVGVLILFYSAVNMLTNIEASFNRIWGVQRGRPFFLRFAIYWCLLTLAPPLIGFSVSLSAQLQNSTAATFVLGLFPFGLGRYIISLLTTLTVCLTFIFSYLIVPNTKVHFRSALWGGLVAGFTWNILKAIFIVTSAGTIKYSAVYGALGVLPLLMIWMYWSWIIVLGGATFTFIHQTISSGTDEDSLLPESTAFREELAINVSLIIAREFYAGRTPPGLVEIVEEVGICMPIVRRTLESLVDHGILVEVAGEHEAGYLPGKDLARQTVGEIQQILRHKVGQSFQMKETPIVLEIRRLLTTAEDTSSALLKQTDLRTLAAQAEVQR